MRRHAGRAGKGKGSWRGRECCGAGGLAGSALLVGGAVAVGSSRGTEMLVQVAPLDPCDEGSAVGSMQAQDVAAVPTP